MPLVAHVELYGINYPSQSSWRAWRPQAQAPNGVGGLVDPDPIFDANVVLANAAREESLPLPLTASPNSAVLTSSAPASLVYVACSDPKRRAYDSSRTWLDADELRFGKCSAQIDKTILEQLPECKGGPVETCKNYLAYGPQTLLVTVKRDGGGEAKAFWPVRLDDQETWHFTLPVPPFDDKGGGDYSVEVRVTAQSNSVAVYRPGIESKLASDVGTTHPELLYTAHLNPVGPFTLTFGKRARTFVTIPLDVVRVRFPASSRDLQNSGQPAAFEYTSPSTGAIVVVEPWDFDNSRNRWALGMRFLAGAYFFKFSDSAPSFSQVLGISFTLPIIDKPSSVADTSVVFNLMWEKDWRDPIGAGHYFLITTGLNLFSLFGSK